MVPLIDISHMDGFPEMDYSLDKDYCLCTDMTVRDMVIKIAEIDKY